MGAASRSLKARPVDFRQQRGIYALYAEYELVYLGQTGAGTDRLFNRLKAHKSDHLSERWNRFSWFGTQWVTKANQLSTDTAAVSQTVEAALNILEAVSVAIGEPRLNLQRGKWGEATQYYQYWERSDDEDEEDNDA
ncbi:MAG: GIY-YIG nuclease family protein [Steroidobacteraceae bacterium]